MAWTQQGTLRGPPGSDGENAFTLTTGDFTCPPIGKTVTVPVASVDFMVLGQYLYVETAGGSSGAAGLMQVVAINGNPPGPYTEIIRGVTPVPPPVVPALPAGIEITPVGPPPKSPGINLNSVDIVVPPPGETVTVELPDLTGITVGKDLFVTEVEAERGTKRGLKVTAKLRVTAVAGNAVTLLNPG